MAHGKQQARIYLGYVDEQVTDKYRSEVTFRTNKIGGKADWHNDKVVSAPECRLCGLQQLSVVQIYAPLENSKYHRTLYIFACINANCWNQNESWSCLRVQSLDQHEEEQQLSTCDSVCLSATSWLEDADNWGDSLNDNEQNGNNMMLLRPSDNESNAFDKDDDEFNCDFAQLTVGSDPNANSPASIESPVGVGAVGRLDSPLASAEIEGAEGEVVCIDTPTEPQCDLISLLHQVTPLPINYATDKTERSSLLFNEIFISVEPESLHDDVSQHVHDLLLKYQKEDKDWLVSTNKTPPEEPKAEFNCEKYEKSTPIHGDTTFYEFVSRIKQNPGQILRYSRDNNVIPLLLYSISGCVDRCRHCGDEMIFELQVLPSLIPKLQLNSQSDQHFQLEYGTVLIYTCVRSCWSPTDSYREEHVIVQPERF